MEEISLLKEFTYGINMNAKSLHYNKFLGSYQHAKSDLAERISKLIK